MVVSPDIVIFPVKSIRPSTNKAPVLVSPEIPEPTIFKLFPTVIFVVVLSIFNEAPESTVTVPEPKPSADEEINVPAETEMPPLLSLVPDKDKVPVPDLVKTPESVIEPA